MKVIIELTKQKLIDTNRIIVTGGWLLTERLKELKEPVSFRLMNNAAALENVFKQKILLIYLTTEFQGPLPTSVIYKDVGNPKL